MWFIFESREKDMKTFPTHTTTKTSMSITGKTLKATNTSRCCPRKTIVRPMHHSPVSVLPVAYSVSSSCAVGCSEPKHMDVESGSELKPQLESRSEPVSESGLGPETQEEKSPPGIGNAIGNAVGLPALTASPFLTRSYERVATFRKPGFNHIVLFRGMLADEASAWFTVFIQKEPFTTCAAETTQTPVYLLFSNVVNDFMSKIKIKKIKNAVVFLALDILRLFIAAEITRTGVCGPRVCPKMRDYLAACLWIAFKFETSDAPDTASGFLDVYVTDSRLCSCEEVRQLLTDEKDVLQTINFNVALSTSFDFLDFLLSLLFDAPEFATMNRRVQNAAAKMLKSSYLNLVSFLPSEIACACVFAALQLTTPDNTSENLDFIVYVCQQLTVSFEHVFLIRLYLFPATFSLD